MKDFNLSEYDANLLSHDRNLASLFEETEKLVNDPNTTANWILTELSRRLNEAEQTAEEMNLSVENFAKLINLAKNNKINNNVAKNFLEKFILLTRIQKNSQKREIFFRFLILPSWKMSLKKFLMKILSQSKILKTARIELLDSWLAKL